MGTRSRQNTDDRIRKYHPPHRTRSSRCRELLKSASRALKLELQRRDPDIKPLKLGDSCKNIGSFERNWMEEKGRWRSPATVNLVATVASCDGTGKPITLLRSVWLNQTNETDQSNQPVAWASRFTLHPCVDAPRPGGRKGRFFSSLLGPHKPDCC